MEQHNEELRAAIDDVNSAANALRELRERIQTYGEATTRLDTVSDALIKLSAGVECMHTGVAAIVQRAEAIQTALQGNQSVVELLTASVPEIVARIEASDTTKSIADFTKLLQQTRETLRTQEEVAQGLRASIDAFSSLAADLRSMRDSSGQQAQLLQLINQVLMQNIAGPVNESVRHLGDIKSKLHDLEKDSTKSADGMRSHSEKLFKEIEATRSEIISLRAESTSAKRLLEEQSARIEALSKRKGLIF